MIEDRRREARFTEHRFVTLGRHPLRPNCVQLALQRGPAEGPLGQFWQAVGCDILERRRRLKGQDRFSEEVA